MIGSWIDSAISVLSPATAVRRMHARAVYSNLRQRSYDAAKRNRLNADWRTTNQSADAELYADADLIRARSRDLARNHPHARGVLRAWIRNVVSDGIMPQGAVKIDGESAVEINQQLEELFDRWQRHACLNGQSFYEAQRLGYSEALEAGEFLVHFTESDDPQRVLPFSIELIEADRLASDAAFPGGRNVENGHEIRRGVEIDSNGKPVAYWLYSRNPQDTFPAVNQQPVRHDAANFLHLFRPQRIGQTRGVSIFAPVVLWLRNINRYLHNELEASAIASCFTVAVKTPAGGGGVGLLPSGDTTEDSRGNKLEVIEPGLVARLLPDESVEVINPSRGQSEASPWINLLLRTVGVGTGLSYERLTRDYSQTNYSSNRAADLEDRREFRIEQQFLMETLCHETWVRFVAAAVASGQFDWLPDAEEFIRDFHNWTAVTWHPPGWEWVDPAKEASSSETALRNNLSTLRDEIGKRGGDWRDILKQRSLEAKLIAEAGLTATAAAPVETKESEEQNDG